MKKLARFNWYVMLVCALIFAIGGTLAGLGAIVLSGNLPFFAVALALSIGLYASAFCTLMQMEYCELPYRVRG